MPEPTIEIEVTKVLLARNGEPFTVGRLLPAAEIRGMQAKLAALRQELASATDSKERERLAAEIERVIEAMQEPLTMGRAMVDELESVNPAGLTPARRVLAKRVGDKIMEAMEQGRRYVAGEIIYKLLREVVEQNGGGYPLRVCAMLAEELGVEPAEGAEA